MLHRSRRRHQRRRTWRTSLSAGTLFDRNEKGLRQIAV